MKTLLLIVLSGLVLIGCIMGAVTPNGKVFKKLDKVFKFNTLIFLCLTIGYLIYRM